MKYSEQKKRAKKFAQKWKNTGDEKSESQKFWLDLLENVFGVEDPYSYINFESRVKKMDKTAFIDGYIEDTHVLIEQKSSSKDLSKAIEQSDRSYLTPFQQAKRYSAYLPYSLRPRWIITCNFKEFYIYDMEKPNGDPEIIKLEDLEDEIYRLNFLISKEEEFIIKETQISIEAGEIVSSLYNALLLEYQNPKDKETLHALNILCVRIVFCLYAEDAGLFGHKNMFHDYLEKYKDANPRRALMDLFKILNTKEEDRDPYETDELLSFPYVNGGLFEDKNIEIPRLNPNIVDIILNRASLGFDWSKISPTIFGSVFESTLNPETRRSGGMHYTSIKNIHKVIDPLFLNDLKEEFEEIMEYKQAKRRNRKLEKLHEKIANLKFLDPAAGSGNFLTETYISLRKLENEIIKAKLGDGQLIFTDTSFDELKNPIRVNLGQFYGIEINDFATTVARTALWISEDQMMKETAEIIHMPIDFLPLKSYSNIVEANALTYDWNDLIKAEEIDYIMGNPPFVGARLMNKEQNKDIRLVFGEKYKNVGNLDYVAGWYKKSADYIDGSSIEVSLVSTNSICQGEQVAILWQDLYKNHNIVINFAYQTFRWDSEAITKAHVHCVIVGFAQFDRDRKYIYPKENAVMQAKNINGYLVDGPNIFIKSRRTPLSNVYKMSYGSFALDDGAFTISYKEYESILKQEPFVEEILRPFLGAKEFINKIKRYCVWLDYNDINLIKKSKILKEKIEHVQTWRANSNRKNTKEASKTPMIFAEIRQPNSDYLAIPVVSSENRKYIPVGYLPKEVIASNQLLIVPSAQVYHFSIISSNVHMAWMRAVAGRLKSDYRYSASIVYNNFPWPNLNEFKIQRLNKTGNDILSARDLYKEWSYADLYNSLTMPKELIKAHQENDKAVMEAYGFDWRTMTESEFVAELMKMYKKLVEESK